ncbi:MAG: amidohydrolase, partial [Planctomycetes bacterium]|nr:amidohydrolase [Planctomycetota bacterium]
PGPAGRALLDRALAGLELARVWDVHVHVIGLGAGGSGCWVNPRLRKWWNLVENAQFDAYRSGAGIRDLARGDAEYVERLVELQRLANPLGKSVALAFDAHVREDGSEDLERTPFRVPDEYVARLAREHAELAFCASIHPYRADALERLERAAADGAVLVKWLPNAQGIDPSSQRCDAFYRRLVELGVPLLTHTGVEHAVDAAEQQELGNPLRLRRPLDQGVRVIAAHCASLGRCRDDERGGEARAIDLFLRLMGEAQYRERLYGDLSAIVLVNRERDVLGELLGASELHPRLLYGSDYPLVAIDPVVSTWWLERQGYVDEADRAGLEELFDANPLLFDLVLRRVVRDASGRRFADACFHTRDVLRAI